MSVLVGLCGGISAITLFVGLEYTTHYCQTITMGVEPAAPSGEHVEFSSEPSHGPMAWAVILLPALGAFLGGVLVYRYAPEAEGHGMDAAISAFHHEDGVIRSRVPLIKGIASILTIGAGGSGGREGPIAQIGGGLGSKLADLCGMSKRERRIFMLAGIAAGIGAIFRAPLGGALAATEILYKEDIESSAVIPCIVSSVTAYTVFRVFLEYAFGITSPTIYAFPAMWLDLPEDLFFYSAMAVGCTLAGKLYVYVFHSLRVNVFARIPLPKIFCPALGGLLVGLIGWFTLNSKLPGHTVGSGHGFLQEVINLDLETMQQSEALVFAGGFLLLAVLRILVTSLTIGSGGSGGVFGPSLLIGGLAGAAVGCLFKSLFGEFPLPPAGAFVVLGMAGFFAGVANAPIGAVVMVSEMTGSYALLAPLLLVCVINVLLNRKSSLYESQVETRFDSPAHKTLMITDFLAEETIRNYFRHCTMPVVNKNMSAVQFRNILADESIHFPLTVVDDGGTPCGIISMGNLRSIYFKNISEALFIVEDAAGPFVSCTPDETLASALHKFEEFSTSRIPVRNPDSPSDFLGFIQYQDVMKAYETELMKQRTEDEEG